MADGLIPDFSPEAYTSGQGTGYAQVFNLQGPNPFQTTQNTYDKLLAIEKDRLKKTYENEEKRQEKLDDFLSSIHDYDNAWEMGKVQLGKEIDTYGNLISGMRAQGKAIDVNTLNKSKKKIADLAKANEDNQKNYAKIAAIMADPIVYTDEERKAFQDDVKAEAQKDIFNVQEYLGKWSASLATPNIAADYIKLKPEAKSDTSGYIKATNEDEAKTVVVDNVWASYPDIQKKKSLSDMVQLGLVKSQTVENAKVDGEIDFQNQALKDEIGNALFTQIRPYLEYDKTPKPAYRSSDSSNTKLYQDIGTRSTTNDSSELGQISLGKKGFNYFATGIEGEGSVYMDPHTVKYDDEYVGSNGERYPAGWYVYGTIQKELATKPISEGQSEESLIQEVAKQYNTSPDKLTYSRNGDQVVFSKLIQRRVPYGINSSMLQTYDLPSLEEIAKAKGYKTIRGLTSLSQSSNQPQQQSQQQTQKGQQQPTTTTGGGAFKGGVVL